MTRSLKRKVVEAIPQVVTLRLCKGVTYHVEGDNTQRLVLKGKSHTNNTIFYRDGPNNTGNVKEFTHAVYGNEGLTYETLRAIVIGLMLPEDQANFGRDFLLLKVNENEAAAVNTRAVTSITAVRMQPAVELDDTFEAVAGDDLLLCFIKRKEAVAHLHSKGGSMCTFENVLVDTINRMKGEEGQNIITNGKLSSFFSHITFKTFGGHNMGAKDKQQAVFAIIEEAGDKSVLNSNVKATVYDVRQAIMSNIKRSNFSKRDPRMQATLFPDDLMNNSSNAASVPIDLVDEGGEAEEEKEDWHGLREALEISRQINVCVNMSCLQSINVGQAVCRFCGSKQLPPMVDIVCSSCTFVNKNVSVNEKYCEACAYKIQNSQ